MGWSHIKEAGVVALVFARAAGNSPPTASAVETAATKNEHEDDDDQKGSAIHGSLRAETSNLVGLQTSAPSAPEPTYISSCALLSALSTPSYETVHCAYCVGIFRSP